jgi:hypothetical protein
MVQDARLSICGAGEAWDKVELLTPSTSSTSTSGDDD